MERPGSRGEMPLRSVGEGGAKGATVLYLSCTHAEWDQGPWCAGQQKHGSTFVEESAEPNKKRRRQLVRCAACSLYQPLGSSER